MKRLLRRAGVQRAIAWLAAQYMRLAYHSSRWRVIGGERPELRSGAPFIGAFWHGRMLMIPFLWNRRGPIRILISEHADGRFISRVIAHFAIDTVVGSSSNGGAAALRRMARTLRDGVCVAVTPDGPRGPRMRAAAGIVVIAKLAGVPIIPGTYSTTRGRALGSWDRFLLALPFGRGVFLIGDPIVVPPEADAAMLEAARLELEARLNAITAEADAMCGRIPIEPMPETRSASTAAASLGEA